MPITTAVSDTNSNYREGRMEGPKPTACTIDLTEGCNLACDYCFTWSKHKRRVIDKWMVKRIIDFWLPQTDPKEQAQLSWWGGEPLLEWNLIKSSTEYAQRKAKDLGKKIIFGGTTNGVLYTPDKVEWTVKNDSLFLVSLDGVKASHDLHRKCPDGSGTWDTVVKNVREALKIVPNLKVRASFGPDTMQYFYESILFFFEDLGLQDVAFSAVYEGEWTERTWETMEEQFTKATQYAVKRMKEGKPCVLKHLNDEACASFEYNPQNPCGAGSGYMAWSVDGYGFPCHRFNKHGITTEERAKLPTIIARPTEDSFEWVNPEWKKSFSTFKDNPPEKCKTCEIYGKSICNGGCYAVNHDFTGDIKNPPEVMCRYNKVQNKVGKLFHDLASKEGLRVNWSGWNGAPKMDDFVALPCICYNMCYSEGTPEEIKHIDRRTGTMCLCNMTVYNGENNPASTRQINLVDAERAKLKQIFGVVKQILQSRDAEKTPEQLTMENQILQQTIRMLDNV
jgi:uncharacterized protein